MTRPINVEIFSCAGGMAEGFRRAGILFDMAVDKAPDHVTSYETNLGHRPITMDATDLLRMIKAGWSVPVDLLVADPPCTPWSRAGKRKGQADERDMLGVTAELIQLLRPRRYLIGNVPGLDDQPNWHIVQKVIGGLERFGYCVADFAALDAADYGVPQRRVRPFWFGHQQGPCIRWPQPTHTGDQDLLSTLTIPGVEPLLPWVTCRQALGHLRGEDLGRPVKLRRRNQNSKQHGSVADKPARVVGTSNLSDGNVVVPDVAVLTYNPNHPPSYADEPAMTQRAGCGGGATRALQLSSRDRTEYEGGYTPATMDAPAATIVRNTHGNGSVLLVNDRHPPATADAPSPTVGAKQRSQSSQVLDLTPSAPTKGKPRARDKGRVAQGHRVGHADKPGATLTARSSSRVGGGAATTIEWPWDRPSTTVAAQGDGRIAPPGHHDENFAIMSLPGAVLLSEKAAIILQGFPESWVIHGDTKDARWNQIGQAMPPPLAHAVASSIVDQERRHYEELADQQADRIEQLMAKGDNIGALFQAVQDAGGTVRLHGEPVTARELRAVADVSMVSRLTGQPMDPDDMLAHVHTLRRVCETSGDG